MPSLQRFSALRARRPQFSLTCIKTPALPVSTVLFQLPFLLSNLMPFLNNTLNAFLSPLAMHPMG
jgi:hypothetical protein